jgi:hypothetical protein
MTAGSGRYIMGHSEQEQQQRYRDFLALDEPYAAMLDARLDMVPIRIPIRTQNLPKFVHGRLNDCRTEGKRWEVAQLGYPREAV